MKIVKIVFPLALLSLFCLSFFSCSKDDNPIIPPVDTTYHFDSARYDWTVDILFNDPYGDLYVPDTNNLYLITDGNLLWKHGNSTDYIPLPFQCYGMDGLGNNNIYLAGSQGYVGTKRNVIKILKYNGSTFTNLNFPTDTVAGEFTLNYVYAVSENEVWLSGYYNSRIYRYDGTEFHRYDLDRGFRPSSNFVKNSEGLFIHTTKYFSNGSPDSIRIYKFDGTLFNPVYSVKINGSLITNYLMYNMDNYIFNIREDGIYKFTGGNFMKVVSSLPVNFYIDFGGKNQNDLLLRGYSGPRSDSTNFIHWNGNKWSKEFPALYGTIGTLICKTSDKYYIAFYNGTKLFLYKGRPKN